MADDGPGTDGVPQNVTERAETRLEADDAEIRVVDIDVPSRFDLVTVVRMVVASCSSAAGVLEGDRLDDLRWVVSEATTNAIQANQTSEEPGRVSIRCEIGADSVRLRIRDEGPGMPPELQIPEITSPDRLDIEGGFGIPLMRTLSNSEVVFTTDDSGTTVEMELSQEPPDPPAL